MKPRRKRFFSLAVIFLAVVMVSLSFPGQERATFASSSGTGTHSNSTSNGKEPFKTGLAKNATMFQAQKPFFAQMLANWVENGAKPANTTVTIPGTQVYQHSDQATVNKDSYKGKSNVMLWKTKSTSWIEYKVNVPQTGLYSMKLFYHPYMGTSVGGFQDVNPASFDVAVDGDNIFREAKGIPFRREFHDKLPLNKNSQGDDIRPMSVQYDQWMSAYFRDSAGAYANPLEWYLTKGTHTIRFTSRESVAIDQLQLLPPPTYPDYAKVSAKYPKKKGQGLITFQAQNVYKKNDVAIQMRSSQDPLMTPKSEGHIIFNSLGGNGWRYGGQTATWRFHVNKSGTYEIAMRALQDFIPNQSIFRTIRIDGKVPFRSLLTYRFAYQSGWHKVVLHDAKGNPYQFYMTPGDHTISMTANYGPFQQVLAQQETAVLHLNVVSQELNSLTGGVVDTARTWNIEKNYPELINQLKEIEQELNVMSEEVTKINKGKNSAATALATSAKDIETLLNNPDNIPGEMSRVSSISSKVGSIRSQLIYAPLQLDKFYLAPMGAKLPAMQANLWTKITSTVADFTHSFTRSNQMAAGNGKVLHIWAHYGRDYVNLLQQMADQYFTPKTGIKVKIDLVPSTQVLVLANAANKQPDAVLGLGEGEPVNFGMRGAALDLSQFPDFKKAIKNFAPGSMQPYYYDHHYYGLPETLQFQMLFYRKDILKRLGLKVPQTWQDVYKMLPTLEQNHYNFFISPGNFLTFMYQNGASFYNKTGTKAGFDTPQAYNAFKKFTDLYNVYGAPQQVQSFYQHFRDGDIPIGLADFNTYLQLKVAAPELNGWWAMAPVPGVKQKDGTIVRWSGGNAGALAEGLAGGGKSGEATGGQTSVMIYQKTKMKQQAWKFLKWWLSANTQAEFGNTLESYYGVSFRWNTANIKAFSQLPWKPEERQAMLTQWKWYKTMVNIPGSYMIPRDMQNAWNRTVLDGENYRTSLQTAETNVNREIERKEIEFGERNQYGKVLKTLPPPVINKPWDGVKPYVNK